MKIIQIRKKMIKLQNYKNKKSIWDGEDKVR